LDIFVADFSTSYLKSDFKFDAIVCDPPYGIREKAKKIGDKDKPLNEDTNKVPAEIDFLNENSSAVATDKFNWNTLKTTKYMLGEIFNDLMDFAGKHLNENGRLTFWLPVFVEVDRNTLSYVFLYLKNNNNFIQIISRIS
jgi:tRNA (guanine10-N2)-methyltransferase